MKNRLIIASIIIAAVVLVGCGKSRPPEPLSEPPKIIYPDYSKMLIEAADDGNIEAVKVHIAITTDINAKNEKGYNALHYAVIRGHIEIVELLIDNGADIESNSRFLAYRPLHHACYYNHEEIAELLIKKGAKVNAGSRFGTPLLTATSSEHWRIAKLLLANGANPESNYYPDGQSSLFYSVQNNSKEIAQLLIAKGANLNTRNKDSMSLLYLAAQEGHKEIVELLIDKGVDINDQVNGKTPLESAVLNKHYEIALLLRKHGGKTAEAIGEEAVDEQK